MKYLGTYQSNLSTWHVQELLKLLETAVQQGEYSAGKTFDQTALSQLYADGQSFTQLPTVLAGQRSTDDSLNRPFDLLRARFAALLQETAEFDTRAAALLAMLDTDSGLIDQLVFAAGLAYWVSQQPHVGTRQDLAWDFGMGHGHVATDIPLTDPLSDVVYPSRPPVVSCLTDKVRTGLVAPATIRTVPVKWLQWHVHTTGEVEELAGVDWTKLSVLEAKPLVTYAGVPTVTPSPHPFHISGQSTLGGTPVYVRVQFTSRRNRTIRRVTTGAAFALSPTGCTVSIDDVVVMAADVVYDPVTHYTVDPDGTFTPVALPADQDVTVWFLEYFPSYQCSVNQRTWSPVVMLDAARPYSDTETQFRPIPLGRATDGTATLPITDELGNPTGLFIQLGSAVPVDDWSLVISNPGNPEAVGATALLELEMAQPTYLNALRVSPFTTFPLVLKRVEVEGLVTSTRHSVYEGSTVVDRMTLLRFDRTLVRRVYLTWYQENYTLKEYSVESVDALRSEVMTSLQSALPYAIRRAPSAVPTPHRGAVYEFGLEALEGQDWVSTKGVFVSGPHRVMGCPEVLRIDAEVTGDVSLYLCYRAYNAAGVIVDENLVGANLDTHVGADPLTPSTAFVFPFATDLDRSTVARTDVYLKMVHRSLDAVVERFLIQVATHV